MQINGYFLRYDNLLPAHVLPVFESVPEMFIERSFILFVFPDKMLDTLVAYHQ
jgi:hypothetical protein